MEKYGEQGEWSYRNHVVRWYEIRRKTVKGTYTLYAIPGRLYYHYQQRLECLGILLL
jgi:hypothetical protein